MSKLREITVSLFQMDVVPGDPMANVEKVRRGIEKLETVPDAFMLPELWTEAFTPDMGGSPHDQSRCAIDSLRDVCGNVGMHMVAGSLPWRAESALYNRSWVIDDLGEPVAFYDKAHLFSKSGEDKVFQKGGKPLFFQLGEYCCSIATCYDIRFPEYTRSISLAGADILFVGAQWAARRRGAWELLVRAAAANGQMYVVACNCTGSSSGQVFCGNSMVVSPWGDVIARMGEEEGVLTASFDPGEVGKCRASLPVGRDRRPELYGFLSGC